jgi:hypothetical protein
MIPDLPDWDSLPAVTRFHNWAEMAGIVFLALLVVAEVVSYKYGHRRDILTGQQQTATDKRHDDEIARVHLETAQYKRTSCRARKRSGIAPVPIRPRSTETRTAILNQ